MNSFQTDSAKCEREERRSHPCDFVVIVMATVSMTSHEDSIPHSGLVLPANSPGCTTNAFK
jgi:hypothetical protein